MFTSRYCVCGTCPYILKVKENEREREREKKERVSEWERERERESNFRRRFVSACSGTSPDFPHSCTAWSTVSPVDIACLPATGSPQAWFSHPCLPGATKPLSGYIKAIYGNLEILTGHPTTSKNTLLSRWQPGPVSFERQNELAHEAEKNCQKWRQESVRKPVTKDPSAQKSSHIVTCVAEAFFETASFSTIVSLCFLKEISKSSQTHVSLIHQESQNYPC